MSHVTATEARTNLYRLIDQAAESYHPIHISGRRADAYSRRIDIQHRLAYEVFAQQRTVRVLRMWTHDE